MTRFPARPSIARLALLALLCACSSEAQGPIIPGPPPPPPPEAGGKRILFIGNSLTYSWDIPGQVVQMAVAAGEPSPARRVIAVADYGLEQHWGDGVAQNALNESPRWDVVVMQQGPSTLPASGVNLTEYFGRFAGLAKIKGTRPALYAVWPPAGGNLDAGIANHQAAAQAADAALYPAAMAWRYAWQTDPGLPLYSSDAFHPSQHGSWLAALVISAMIYDKPVSAFPNLFPGVITPAQEATMRSAAALAILQFGKR